NGFFEEFIFHRFLAEQALEFFNLLHGGSKFRGSKGVLDAIDMLRGMNSDSARKVPADAPTAFIKD
ncbi:TPA: hypothetical protein ACIWR4_006104, partial [Escherichia coli]